MRHWLRLVCGALAALSVTACAMTAPSGDPFYFQPVFWRMQPVDFESPAEIQEAQVGEFLFLQDFASARVAEFQAPVSLSVPRMRFQSASPATAEYPIGATFSEVVGVGPDRVAFCDRIVTYASPTFTDGRHMRLCFADRTSDGRFDVVYWAGLMGAAQDNDLFSPATLFIEEGPTGLVDIPYELHEHQTQRLITAGIALRRLALGGYRLEVAAPDNHGPNWLLHDEDDASSSVYGASFRMEDLPITLTIAGARVEIVSFEGDRVRYRTLSAFPLRPIAIAYTDNLPRDTP